MMIYNSIRGYSRNFKMGERAFQPRPVGRNQCFYNHFSSSDFFSSVSCKENMGADYV